MLGKSSLVYYKEDGEEDLFAGLPKYCGEDQESAEHLFVTCGFAQTVWHLVS
ncbi:hypothetical protein Hanom_Chr06g00517681 [Helianthus anomalus]